jgi:hypothetical protein
VPKYIDLEAFTPPLANNMEAIWAVTLLRAFAGKLYSRLSTEKSVWRDYFMFFFSRVQFSPELHINVWPVYMLGSKMAF